MSKERARRRAVREAETAKRAELRARQEAKLARRRGRAQKVAQVLPTRTRWSTDTGLLAAKKRRRYGLVAAGFMLVQFLTWAATPDWWLRVTAAVVSVIAIPVVLAFAS